MRRKMFDENENWGSANIQDYSNFLIIAETNRVLNEIHEKYSDREHKFLVVPQALVVVMLSKYEKEKADLERMK